MEVVIPHGGNDRAREAQITPVPRQSGRKGMFLPCGTTIVPIPAMTGVSVSASQAITKVGYTMKDSRSKFVSALDIRVHGAIVLRSQMNRDVLRRKGLRQLHRRIIRNRKQKGKSAPLTLDALDSHLAIVSQCDVFNDR